MSVIKAKRKESRFEVLVHADNVHDMLLELMQRDFGIKDLAILVRKKYLFGKTQESDYKYYVMVMNQSKTRIDYLSRQLIASVRAANVLYPVSEAELDRRRDYQNNAIASCEQIKSELQRVVDIFEVDINIYARYFQAINREVHLIKTWRQRDNKLKSRLQ